MKKTIIPVLMLLPLIGAAQKSYTITGKINGLNEPAKVYLVTMQSNQFKDTDSSTFVNGAFQFNGSVTEPQQAALRLKRVNTPETKYRPDMFDFFLENSQISVTAKDSIKYASVNGSVADREYRDLEAIASLMRKTIARIQDEFGKKNNAGVSVYPLEIRKSAGESVQKTVEELRKIRLMFATSHPQSFMGLFTFNEVLDQKFVPTEMESLFNNFSAELKSSPLGKKTLERINIAKRAQTGIKATDFTQNDLNGKPFTLSSLRGKYVLVDFWASWCAPCRAENPNVIKAYNELKGKNFEIVGVSLDYPGSKEAWAAAVKSDGLPWIQVSDLKGWKNEVALTYGINSVPQNLLIDPQGMIIGKNLRGEALTEKLKQLIK
ncbi:redoxin domain-containing protein [Pedobacter sp. R-06]|uniref:redoxin domain-containing protein n=1 Tax=Pedobacter sp. R-06 TaxID=3404051 RepID=UPI003CF05651